MYNQITIIIRGIISKNKKLLLFCAQERLWSRASKRKQRELQRAPRKVVAMPQRESENCGLILPTASDYIYIYTARTDWIIEERPQGTPIHTIYTEPIISPFKIISVFLHLSLYKSKYNHYSLITLYIFFLFNFYIRDVCIWCCERTCSAY